MYAVFYLVISLAQFETVVPWQQLIELLPAEVDELDNVTSAGDQPSSAFESSQGNRGLIGDSWSTYLRWE